MKNNKPSGQGQIKTPLPLNNIMENTDSEYKTVISQSQASGEVQIFFAGDVITPSVKTRDNTRKRGGIALNVPNLSWNGGYLPRCEITPLKDAFHSERAGFIEEAKRPMMTKTYTAIENGVATQVGLARKIVDNGLGAQIVTGGHDGLLRTPVYPVMQVDRVTGKGVVVMPCETSQRSEIQRFLFPNWEELKQGGAAFPPTISQLRAYFEERFGAAQNTTEQQCVNAAIMSCDEYAAHYATTLREHVSRFESYKQKGQPYQFGERMEMIFTQLSVQRPDRVAQGQADQLSELTSNINKLASVMVNNARQNQTPQAEKSPEMLAMEAEIAVLRAKVAAGEAAQTPNVTIEEPVETVETVERVKCAAIKSNGEQCGNTPLENSYCSHPAHQKLAGGGKLAELVESLKENGN